MAYTVEIQIRALKELAAIAEPDRSRIAARIDGLSEDPRPAGAVKLADGANAWRIRSGDYRIVYLVEDAIRVVTVTRIGHRREVYRRR